jgi:hypothetical protein
MCAWWCEHRGTEVNGDGISPQAEAKQIVGIDVPGSRGTVVVAMHARRAARLDPQVEKPARRWSDQFTRAAQGAAFSRHLP